MKFNFIRIFRLAQEPAPMTSPKEGGEPIDPKPPSEPGLPGGEEDTLDTSKEDITPGAEDKTEVPPPPPPGLVFEKEGPYAKPGGYDDGSGNLKGINDLDRWGSEEFFSGIPRRKIRYNT